MGRVRQLKFPKTVAAAKALEVAESNANRLKWSFAFAMLNECPRSEHGVNNGTKGRLRQLQAQLVKAGCKEYDLDYLDRQRATAAAFPEGEYSHSIPFSIHLVAGDLQTLKHAMAKARAEGEKLTADYVRKFKRSR